jgi:DNA-binding FadR family transcriptional regulator
MEHLAIVGAIRSGDLEAAQQAIRVHINGAAERAIASLQASLVAS